MPELPEIETICGGLQSITKQRITDVCIRNYQLRLPVQKNLAQFLIGQHITKITRRGKYILLTTQSGTLIVHLGMTGSLQIKPKQHNLAKHEHVTIVFNSGQVLCYNDPRRFGLIHWTNKDPIKHRLIKDLGIEPLEKNFTGKYLFERSRRRQVSIKQFLMDNKVVVGVGNIYASEALFAAKINPLRKVCNIDLQNYNALTRVIKVILKRAIKYRGTTFSDYLDSHGKTGTFQNKLKVYGRLGQPCVTCKKPLMQTRIGQRSAVFCPRCQKA